MSSWPSACAASSERSRCLISIQASRSSPRELEQQGEQGQPAHCNRSQGSGCSGAERRWITGSTQEKLVRIPLCTQVYRKQQQERRKGSKGLRSQNS
ncbi:unnamed protein product [Urochloa humidicola]